MLGNINQRCKHARHAMAVVLMMNTSALPVYCLWRLCCMFCMKTCHCTCKSIHRYVDGAAHAAHLLLLSNDHLVSATRARCWPPAGSAIDTENGFQCDRCFGFVTLTCRKDSTSDGGAHCTCTYPPFVCRQNATYRTHACMQQRNDKAARCASQDYRHACMTGLGITPGIYLQAAAVLHE